MTQPKAKVIITPHIESQIPNRVLFDRLAKSIESNCFSLFREYPDVSISITKPTVGDSFQIIIHENNSTPDKPELFQEEILYAIDSVGFKYRDTIVNEKLFYAINFSN